MIEDQLAALDGVQPVRGQAGVAFVVEAVRPEDALAIPGRQELRHHLLAGAGGLVYALYQTNIWYFQGFRAGLIAFTAAVMGGIGNLRGAVLGGFIIGIIQQLSDNRIGAEWTPVIVFSYLILIMTFRPQGLLGEEIREAG